MFNLILSPIIAAVKTWMSDRVYRAAQAGAAEGLQRFAHDFGAQFDALPAPDAAKLEALPMPSAAQVTDIEESPAVCPADRAEAFALAKRLLASGKSQRQAAEMAGVADSTLRMWLAKEGNRP